MKRLFSPVICGVDHQNSEQQREFNPCYQCGLFTASAASLFLLTQLQSSTHTPPLFMVSCCQVCKYGCWLWWDWSNFAARRSFSVGCPVPTKEGRIHPPSQLAANQAGNLKSCREALDWVLCLFRAGQP